MAFFGYNVLCINNIIGNEFFLKQKIAQIAKTYKPDILVLLSEKK